MDTGMYKENQQETSDPTSLEVTNEERANPQLSSDMSAFNLNKPIYLEFFIIHCKSASGCHASADSTAKADPGLSAPNDSIPQQQGMVEGTKNTSCDHIFVGANSITRQVEEEEASSTIKLEDLAKLVSNVETSFKYLDSPKDDPVITLDDSDEDEKDVHTTLNIKTKETSISKSSSLNSLPTEMKDLPSKFNDLTKQVKGLKNQVHNLKIKLPGDLKEIPPKLEDITKTVTSLTSQVVELKTLQWELPAKFLVVPSQVKMVQTELKTLDALPSLLNKFTNALNQFAQAITSRKLGVTVFLHHYNYHNSNVISLSPTTTQKLLSTRGEHIKEDKGKKALSSEEAEKKSTDSDSDDETYATGSMVEPSRIKKLKKKGPITLKVYIEDGTSEFIPNFKASDLHLGEWREVMKECPNRTRKGWETIYKQIGTRTYYIHMIEAELGINLDIALSKQGPLNKLYDLANKKRKHADDIHDYFKANKRLKSSVQYKDHLPGTVLNEPVLEIEVIGSRLLTVEALNDLREINMHEIEKLDHLRTMLDESNVRLRLEKVQL
nr:hypothetical protein [Tanacetum cinerariifolium]